MVGRVLIVGQAPSRASGSGQAFRGSASGDRLARILGIDPAELGEVVETANLLAEWPGRAAGGAGDRFDLGAARAAAAAMLGRLAAYRRVVLCGRGVAEAFLLGDMEALEWREAHGTVVGYLPHPSGVSRWWNDPRNRARAREFAADLGLENGLFDEGRNKT